RAPERSSTSTSRARRSSTCSTSELCSTRGARSKMALDATLLEIVVGFVPEATELCDKVSRDLLSLEDKPGRGEPAPDVYKSRARGVHTLKGPSATLGLDDLSEIAHAMEDVVAPLHKADKPIPAAVADELLRTLDTFQKRLREHAEGRSDGLEHAAPI